MQSVNNGPSSFLLSPSMRKQRHDLMNALSTLQAAVIELQLKSDVSHPNLKSREILKNSDKAIGTIKTFIDRQFETNIPYN